MHHSRNLRLDWFNIREGRRKRGRETKSDDDDGDDDDMEIRLKMTHAAMVRPSVAVWSTSLPLHQVALPPSLISTLSRAGVVPSSRELRSLKRELINPVKQSRT